MKNILKNKKLLIGLGVAILLIIAIVVVVLVTNPKSENNEIPNNNVDTNTNTNTPVAMEETHTMYVSINPLVKLVFKEEYTICKDENNQEYVCGGIATDIIDYELINDDAKDIYKDLDFTGKTVEDVLLILCDTARDNDIGFESLEITTDSNNVDSDVLMNYLKENSTYEDEYVVYVNFEEYIDESIIENDNINEGNKDDNNETDKDNSNNTSNNENDNNPSENQPNENDHNNNNNNENENNKPTTDNPQQDDTEVDTPAEEENTSNITSTIDRINLNDNILVYISPAMIGCGYSSFINGDVSSVLPGFRGEMLEEEDWNLISNTLGFNTEKEDNAMTILKQMNSNLPIGVSEFTYKFNNHRFEYGYSSLVLHGDYGDFGKEWENLRTNWYKKVQIAFQDATTFSALCGSADPPVLLTEELCNEYNLTCDRW